jgi:hypothetical protein
MHVLRRPVKAAVKRRLFWAAGIMSAFDDKADVKSMQNLGASNADC